jgi:hypothetical protein
MRVLNLLVLLSLTALFQSCSSTGSVEEPENLIDENLMENILYELSILDAMSSFTPRNPDFEKIYGKPYIFLKYKIDSLQLAESDNYYAKFPRVYHKIYSNVLARMNKTKESLDLLGKEQKKNQK